MVKYCYICGKRMTKYQSFCEECEQQGVKRGITKCIDCKVFHFSDIPCPKCGKMKKSMSVAQERETKNKPSSLRNELNCIICGDDSNGKHFCRSCYKKYSNRSVDIRIINCSDIKILDEYGNLQYTCDDGRKVRSRAEHAIANWLFHNKIRFVYEMEVFYKENGANKILHPDFYLPDEDIYIEYNELKNKSYRDSKEYSSDIYSKIGKKVIVMSESDLENISACLKPKLGLH